VHAQLNDTRAVERKHCPVFVVGCHRSGTNLLYDTLLSAGGFAIYRGYLPVYKMLIPRFGSMAKLENRKRALKAWGSSKGFRRSGLDSGELETKVVNECETGGDFIRIVMSEISRSQKAPRWAVYDPDNVLYIPKIKADIPEALFLHIIRDGRDVALSLKTIGGFTPLPWNGAASGLQPAALYWEWMVRKGQRDGKRISADYLEVRYEELVSEPRVALKRVAEFLDHDLDHDRVQQAKLGRLSEPNSSFPEARNDSGSVHRWKSLLSTHDVASIEAVVGPFLEELGYPLSSAEATAALALRKSLLRSYYFGLLKSKLWLKTQTPMGRLANLHTLEMWNPAGRAEAE
jgi:hypothetical protein